MTEAAKMRSNMLIRIMGAFSMTKRISCHPFHFYQRGISAMFNALLNGLPSTRSLGMENGQIMPTGGHPAVMVNSSKLEIMRRQSLFMDTMIIQPVDRWNCGPAIRLKRVAWREIYTARGSSDMKGPSPRSLKAVESIVRTSGLAVNIKWLIEGEEEIGSANLGAFIKKNAKMLKADFCNNPMLGMISANAPTITYGLRGLAILNSVYLDQTEICTLVCSWRYST